jgi:hypothetical protein
MAAGNGAYESIPDSDQGGSTSHPPTSGGKKWWIGSAVLIAVVGAAYGATTFLGDKSSSSDSTLKAIASSAKLHLNSEGKLKLFDEFSKLFNRGSDLLLNVTYSSITAFFTLFSLQIDMCWRILMRKRRLLRFCQALLDTLESQFGHFT